MKWTPLWKDLHFWGDGDDVDVMPSELEFQFRQGRTRANIPAIIEILG